MTVSDTIKQIDGIQDPTEDLNLTSEEYDALIDNYILAVTDWLEYYLDKEYTVLPDGLEQILTEIVANMINSVGQRQDMPVMDTEETPSKQVIEAVLTSDIVLRLKPYKKKTRIGIMGVGTKTQYDALLDIEDDDD